MKLLGSAAILALSANAMTKQQCMDSHPAGSAALGRCIKNVNKAARAAEQANFRANKAAEQATFHARAQSQKQNLRQIKDLRSQLQKTGQQNKVDNKLAKETATSVWAENRKQALLQFALKKLGLRKESHVCRKDGSDISIDAGEVSETGEQNVSFAIQNDDVAGKFWLLVKSGQNISLTSLTVDIASEAVLHENQPPNYEVWNVSVNEEYQGSTDFDALANMASESEFTSDNIWWFYCMERRPVGSNGQTFPMVMTEPDNDTEPECTNCLKAYVNNNGVSGWFVTDGSTWTSLPDGILETEVCLHSKPFVYASMAQDASSCVNFFQDCLSLDDVVNHDYFGVSADGACGTLVPSQADIKTIRDVGPDGALTVFYDDANGYAIHNVDGSLKFFSNSDCTGSSVSADDLEPVDSNDFSILQTGSGYLSVQAAGISCIDISNIPAGQNMHSISDVMKFGEDSWVWIRLTQPTPFHHTKLRVDYSGASSIGKFHVHSYQSDDLSDCTSVGGHYNPFNVDLSASAGTHENWEIGDLSGKHGKFSDWGVTDEAGSKIFHDVNLPIWGRHSVAARGLVLHDSATGARTGCANFGHMCMFWDRQPPVDEVRIDYTGSDVWGYQILQQRQNCPWCATSVKSKFQYKDQSDDYWIGVCNDEDHALYSVCQTGSAENKFHIHTIRDDVFEWSGCGNNGGHYNPQVGVPCISGYQGPNSDLCELGDLNNKMGKLVIGNQGWTTSQETDLYAPLTESSQGYNFSNRSITIHAPSGARLTCGPTDLN